MSKPGYARSSTGGHESRLHVADPPGRRPPTARDPRSVRRSRPRREQASWSSRLPGPQPTPGVTPGAAGSAGGGDDRPGRGRRARRSMADGPFVEIREARRCWCSSTDASTPRSRPARGSRPLRPAARSIRPIAAWWERTARGGPSASSGAASADEKARRRAAAASRGLHGGELASPRRATPAETSSDRGRAFGATTCRPRRDDETDRGQAPIAAHRPHPAATAASRRRPHLPARPEAD